MGHCFGVVPSRRLGRSLGVNNIPYKYCSYSCVYCQLGPTSSLTVRRRAFYPPSEVVEDVRKALRRVGEENVDYVTFVPYGEPTLDVNLGLELEMLKETVSKPLAVLTNASLLWREDVAFDLLTADLVSIKVDAALPSVWKAVNRPHSSLSLWRILEGVEEFSRSYRGRLIVETMLIEGVNDDLESIVAVANTLERIRLDRVYIAVPTRPPAERWVKPASEEKLVQAYMKIEEKMPGRVELLTRVESGSFKGLYGKAESSILSIASVHPLLLDHALRIAESLGEDAPSLIEKLLASGKARLVEYEGRRYIVSRTRLS